MDQIAQLVGEPQAARTSRARGRTLAVGQRVVVTARVANLATVPASCQIRRVLYPRRAGCCDEDLIDGQCEVGCVRRLWLVAAFAAYISACAAELGGCLAQHFGA